MPPEPVSADDPDEPWWDDEEDWEEEYDYAEILTDCDEAAEDRAHAAQAAARIGTTAALAAIAATAGRRGPGQPGSGEVFPGEHPGPAAQFASGMLFDTMPGGPELARFADQASDGFAGVSDDELLGIVCAWDRVQAHAAARKYAAVAELIRRRPAAGLAEWTGRRRCRRCGMSSPPDELSAGAGRVNRALPQACSAWPATWRSSSPARRPRSGDGIVSGEQGRYHRSPPPAVLDAGRGPRRRGPGPGPGRAVDPGRPARRHRPRRHGGRPGEGEGTPGAGRPPGPGGNLGRGVRQRGAGRPGAARRPGIRS